MRVAVAMKLARDALTYAEQFNANSLAAMRSVGPHTFRRMGMHELLEIYCRVVYASGFKYKTVKSRFPAISKAFHNFDEQSLARMRSLGKVLRVFNNERKARSFLVGSQLILGEGLEQFKRRVELDPLVELQKLPGVGPITRHHFAKDIGVMDTAKPDIWLQRAADLCGAKSVDSMVTAQAVALGERKRVIDLAIWTYGEAGRLGASPRRSKNADCAARQRPRSP